MSEYRVVIENHIDTMEKKVNELLEDGWQLQGGVSMTVATGGIRESFIKDNGFVIESAALFAQAMVKPSESEE